MSATQYGKTTLEIVDVDSVNAHTGLDDAAHRSGALERRTGREAREEPSTVQTQTAEPQHQPHTHAIFVNGREKAVEVNEVTYEQILLLAYPDPDTGPDVSYTITWARNEQGQATGKLLPGETVKVNEKMVFNVKRAVRS
jgi:hypothetical protein